MLEQFLMAAMDPMAAPEIRQLAMQYLQQVAPQLARQGEGGMDATVPVTSPVGSDARSADIGSFAKEFQSRASAQAPQSKWAGMSSPKTSAPSSSSVGKKDVTASAPSTEKKKSVVSKSEPMSAPSVPDRTQQYNKTPYQATPMARPATPVVTGAVPA
jgi:hypothetical protein